MVLDRVSEVPFWTTVKSAFPTEMMAAADCSSPLLVTSSVTTAITATATANARPSERAFFVQRLWRIRPKKVMGPAASGRGKGQSWALQSLESCPWMKIPAFRF